MLKLKYSYRKFIDRVIYTYAQEFMQRLLKCRVILVLIAVISGSSGVYAQQDPMFTQYMFNQLAINPAYAGSREVLSIMMLGRQQWVGFDGAPTTATLTGHSPIIENMAGGASIIYDSFGPVNQTSLYIDYAYHLNINEGVKLSLGLNGGFTHYSIDYNSLQRTQSIDDAYPVNVEQTLLPNFGFGAYLYGDHFYAGLSVPKIIENKYNSDNETFGNGKEIRHYYAMAGFVYRVNDWIVIRPSIMSRLAQGAPFSIDGNINTVIHDKIWLGIMYRLKDSFGGIVQYQVTPQLKLGYAFDLNTNQLKSYHNGTHEVMINYEFRFKKERVANPRYF